MPQLLNTLRWALECISEGSPLPLLGFLSDIGFIATGQQLQYGQSDADERRESSEPTSLSSLTAIANRLDRSLIRRYEDYVLGKCYADLSFERGIDALQRYSGRDRDKGVGFLINRIMERSQTSGMMVSPAVIKALLAVKSDQLLSEISKLAYQPFQEDLLNHYEQLTQSIRNTGELLGSEDIFELERGTAIEQFGQRMALRQTLQAAEFLAHSLPKQKPRGTAREFGVATNILEEDVYPVGGFSSISNRGTIESLLRSELAYLDDHQRPDLFDIKYVRDELLYYSRDENQFFRRRMCFMFVLDASLVQSRVKPTKLNWQQIIYVLGLLVVAVRSLTEWLSSDALRFEIIFAGSTPTSPLEDEASLVNTLFHEEIQSSAVQVLNLSYDGLLERCEVNARQSLCHCIAITASETSDLHRWLTKENTASVSQPLPLITQFKVAGNRLSINFDGVEQDCETDADGWRTATRLLFNALL